MNKPNSTSYVPRLLNSYSRKVQRLGIYSTIIGSVGDVQIIIIENNIRSFYKIGNPDKKRSCIKCRICACVSKEPPVRSIP